MSFVEAAWPSIDPSAYLPCWAIDGLCEHLQAVTDGHINRLLVNFPPRSGKTTITSICYPAWTWARRQQSFRSGPHVRFLCGSYSHELSLTNSNMTRRLISSPWYQSLWGEHFEFRGDQNTKTKFDTSAGGSRLATSVGGSLLGVGGDIIIIDDPHNTSQVESAAERATALTWWREISSTRLNDPKRSAIIVIMQRLHEEDVSGTILSGDAAGDWVHYCVPMRYEWPRHCVTVLGWQDPRGIDDNDKPLVLVNDAGERIPRDSQASYVLDKERQGELMWPERFGAAEVAHMETELGAYMASGRLQQMPVPDKGGIFQRDWWNLYEGNTLPVCDYIVASLDGAFTEKEENDPCALTIWGVYVDKQTNKKRILLLDAWRKHLKFSGPRIERLPRESDEAYRRRTMPHWGLMEWVLDSCNRIRGNKGWHVDKLLIEGKGPGHSVAQELTNRYGNQGWAATPVPVKGDKVARALAVQPTFTEGLIFAPSRDWADMMIDEAAIFPKGKYDDLVDSMTQALKYLRATGLAQTDAEVHASQVERVTHRPRPKPLYPV